MNLLLLLDMAVSASAGAPAVQVGDASLSAPELLAAAWSASSTLQGVDAVAYVDTNTLAFPVGLFAAAAAGVPFVPMNYRLGADQLGSMLDSLGDVVVIGSGQTAGALAAQGRRVVAAEDVVAMADAGAAVGDVPVEADHPAVLLFTSGTTAAPKAAVLRHRNLGAYVIGTVEFASAEEGDASLVSAPPYHVAGLANLLSNLYSGRRIVYLPQFDAVDWVATARREKVTHAMVVPTMLTRIVDVLETDGGGLPALRSLAYGGSRTPRGVVERTMALLPDVGLANAYGLTETSSTIAVLGPDDHRAAAAGDPVAVARLGSAGRVLPTVEVEVRGDAGAVLGSGELGEIFVRGEQVSGEYRSVGVAVDADGWFPTRDRGWLDEDGYLFIEGRSDDTIIRGGENIAPAEIEEVLLAHPDVDACAVVGVPDDEWGQRIAVAVVAVAGSTLDEAGVREFARRSLRGSKTPDVVRFVDELPYTETGKLLRRDVVARLTEAAEPPTPPGS